MNIELKSPCWHLTIQLDNCLEGTIAPGVRPDDSEPSSPSTKGIHPDNEGQLDPSYPKSNFDHWGIWHNGAARDYLQHEEPDHSTEDVMRIIGNYIKERAGKENPKNPYLIDQDEYIKHVIKSGFFEDLETVFWPELPDPVLNGRFKELMERTDNFDISRDSYADLKQEYIIMEDDLMRTEMEEELRDLFGGTLALGRYSTALWVEEFVNDSPNGTEVQAKKRPGPIIRADLRGYRAAMNSNSTDPKYDAKQRMTAASVLARRRQKK